MSRRKLKVFCETNLKNLLRPVWRQKVSERLTNQDPFEQIYPFSKAEFVKQKTPRGNTRDKKI